MKRSEDSLEELTVEEYFNRYKSNLRIFQNFVGQVFLICIFEIIVHLHN